MRKIFTLIAALFIGSAAFAQVDNTFQFVDEEGNVVEDGSTWHAYERTEDMAMGPMIHSGLYVKNTTGEDVGVSVDYEILDAPGGNFQICYPVSCITTTIDAEGAYKGLKNAGNDVHLANSTEDIQIEWIVYNMFAGTTSEVKGTCTVSLQLKRMRPSRTGPFSAVSVSSTPVSGSRRMRCPEGKMTSNVGICVGFRKRSLSVAR